MPNYVVELPFPRAGDLRPDELEAIATRAERVAASVGSGIRWRHSYVTAERIYVVYEAEDETQVRQHLQRLGVPPAQVAQVAATIDAPVTTNTKETP